MVATVAVAGAAAWLLLRPGAPSSPPRPIERDRGAPALGARIPTTTVAISLEGAAVPLVAVVRPGGADVPVLTIPAGMSLTTPGLGEATTAAIANQDGEDMRVSLSNTVGVWIDHFVVLDMDGVAGVVDSAGGLTATLPGPATLSSGDVLGPGEVTMTGAQVVQYLGIDGPNAFTRWEVVLPPLLSLRSAGSLAGRSDDLAAVRRLLPVNGAVRIDTFATRVSAGQTLVPDYGKLDALMAQDFGVRHAPVAVLVQNGLGAPGLAADVAALIVPRGFRVVLSGSAPTFDQRKTQVVASGDDHVREAGRALKALGVGVLGVTEVPSGVADVTIVIGKDFTA